MKIVQVKHDKVDNRLERNTGTLPTLHLLGKAAVYPDGLVEYSVHHLVLHLIRLSALAVSHPRGPA